MMNSKTQSVLNRMNNAVDKMNTPVVVDENALSKE